MLCLSGFERYSRWVPLNIVFLLSDLALCIDNNDNHMTFGGHIIVYLCLLQHHLHPRSARV